MAKSVEFYNWTKEDFTWTWDKVPYTFKAGKTVMMQDYLAEHFANHLTDREMNGMKIKNSEGKMVAMPTDHFTRKDILAKCFPGETIEAPDDDSLEAATIQKNEEKEVKRGRPKKEEEVNPEFEEAL